MTKKNMIAPPWVRFASVLADLCLSYLMYSFLLSLDSFSAVYQKIFLLLIENFQRGVADLTSFFLLYLIYFTLRFYSSLLFSLTPGQWLFAINTEGQGISKRWKASLRTIVEFFTTPLFFIFDGVLLLQKKTLKEILSASTLQISVQLWRMLLGIGGLLFLFSLLYFAPLLTHQKYLSKTILKEVKIESESINSKTNFTNFRLIPSNYFSLASFSSLRDEQIVIVPQYEKLRRESIVVFKPLVLFYDRQSSTYLSFKKGESFNWRQKLKELRSHHPLFGFYYPELNRFALNKDKYNKISYTGETRKKVFSIELESELKRFVKSSFELRFKNSHKHILEHGPFLKSNFILKDFFLSKLDSSYPVELSLMEIGNYNFISLVQIIEHEKERREHLISLSSEEADHYILTSSLEDKADRFRQEFMQSFFGEVEFFGDYESVFKIQDFMKDRKDLMVFDVLINEKIQLEERAVYARELRNHLFEKLRFCSQDPILLPACDQMMSDFKQALNYFNEKYPDFWDGDFLSDEKKVLPKPIPKVKVNKKQETKTKNKKRRK